MICMDITNLKHIKNYDDFIEQFKYNYLARMNGAASAVKFEKASSPEAKARAADAKHKLLTHSKKIADLF